MRGQGRELGGVLSGVVGVLGSYYFSTGTLSAAEGCPSAVLAPTVGGRRTFEVQNDGGIGLAVRPDIGEVGAGAVLDGDGPQAEGADVAPVRAVVEVQIRVGHECVVA